MRYVSRKFDVPVVVHVPPNGTMKLPNSRHRSSMYNLFGNGEYESFAKPHDSDTAHVVESEQEWYSRIRDADTWTVEYDDILEEIYNDFDFPALDLGVAGAVYALNSAGCITGSSCNGGAFDSNHHEDHPLVAFVAKDAALDLLVAAATEVGAGIERQEDGIILLYADHIDPMVAFGPALLARAKPDIDLHLNTDATDNEVVGPAVP